MWIDDQLLRRCEEQVAVGLWVPEEALVVLGSSNLEAAEADIEACAADQVPVLKRYGGGGTVVLHPGCVVISVGCWVRQAYQNKLYFDLLNRSVIAALADGWPLLAGLNQGGLSDLTWATPATASPRKVAGTSLFRSRNYLLYQASLLVDSRLELIERYLRHPTKEPDYRGGRSHRQFILGLGELVPGLTAPACLAQLERSLNSQLRRLLGPELEPSRPEQWAGLLQRAGR